MNAAELLVKVLEQEGIEYIFGVPGEENLDLMEAIRSSNIKFVVTRHEQAAGFMAATIGRLTGRVGVCLSTLGPGATNFVTAAAFAQLGGMPMLMITGQKPIKKSKQGSFQIINSVEMFGQVTKYSRRLGYASSVGVETIKAIRLAEEERPGAVHLELPEDIAGEEVGEVILPILGRHRRPVAEHKAIAQAVEMILAAKRPLLLIGAGANRKLTSKMLTEFIDETGINFFNTQMGKGVIDERKAQYLGTAALSSGDYLHCAIDAADLIINVGHDVVEKPPFIMKPGEKRKVIHINFSSAQIDQIYWPQLEVVGDIANAIWQIKESLKQNPADHNTSAAKNWDFSYFQQIKSLVDSHIKSTQVSSYPTLPADLVAQIRTLMPDDGILSLDNGMYKLWFSRHYPTYTPNSLLLDNALATMGAGLPGGMAAKLVNPDRKVLVVAGDGGFMMNSQELETAVRLKLDLPILIINDNGFGMIKWKQQSLGYHDFGLDFGNPDLIKYAAAYGLEGQRVENAGELQGKLDWLINQAKGVRILEVPIDYTPNVTVLTEQLKNKTCPLPPVN